MDTYKALRGEIKKQMTIKDIKSYQELADMTGFKKSTIAGFMVGKRYSENVEMKIREVLDILDEIST